ncbi:unnamed protein product [Effrenium voratum]|uniref:Tetrapyrrole methylase domain-containing protein n=1 Tax=Effrenium voratum TaxID=2562239 RepID=A0AA36JHQ5_9DINO|nr:unnamed protein product [Effrenium voratum]
MISLHVHAVPLQYGLRRCRDRLLLADGNARRLIRRRFGPGTLYTVAMPIGNLQDASARVVSTLKSVDLIAAESAQMPQALKGLDSSQVNPAQEVVSFYAHNEEERTGELIAALRRGLDVALTARVGTPGVCDPGSKLVSAAHDAGITVKSVPGPCSITAALAASGTEAHGSKIPVDQSVFEEDAWKERRKSGRKLFAFQALKIFEDKSCSSKRGYAQLTPGTKAAEGLPTSLSKDHGFTLQAQSKAKTTSSWHLAAADSDQLSVWLKVLRSAAVEEVPIDDFSDYEVARECRKVFKGNEWWTESRTLTPVQPGVTTGPVLAFSLAGWHAMCRSMAWGACAPGGLVELTQAIRRRPWQEAWHLLQELEARGSAELVAYNAAISACAGAWQQALVTFATLEERQLRADIISCSAAVTACERAARWKPALALLSSLEEREIQGDVIIYAATISACGRPEQWQLSIALLEEAQRKEIQPNVIAYGSAISACRHHWKEAMRLQKGSRQSIVACNAVMDSLRRAEQWQQATAWLEDVRSRTKADIVTYSGLRWQWQRSMNLLEILEKRHLEADVIAYSTDGPWRVSLQLLQKMRQLRLEVNAISVGAAVNSCKAEWQHAVSLLPQTENVMALNAAISACGAAGQWQTALYLSNKSDTDIITYNACISACEGAGQWGTAVLLLRRAQDRRLEPSVVTYNAAISACEEASEWQQALRLVQEMEHQDLQRDIISYNAGITACGKAERWQHAFKLLHEAEGASLEATVITYNATITASAGTWQQASKRLEELRVGNLEPNIITWGSAISACEKSQSEWRWALLVLAPLLDSETANVVALSAAISACEKQKQWQRAIELLLLVQKGRLEASAITYNAAISACEKADQWQEALQIMSEAELRKMELDLITYNAAISSCEVAGQQAMWLLNQAQEVALEPDVITYTSAITALDKSADWQWAMQTLREMKANQVSPDLITFNATVSACARARRWQRVLELLVVLEAWQLAPDGVTYSTALSGCENWLVALQLLQEAKTRRLRVASCNEALKLCEQAQSSMPIQPLRGFLLR